MVERSSGLVVQSVLTIRKLVRELNGRGITIFLTTHNLAEANILCDRVAIINHGGIVAVDTPENLKGAARKVQVVEVSFDRMSRETEAAVSSLAGISGASRQGDKLRLLTDEPSVAISSLTRFAADGGLGITYINTPGPSLEDVFVELTGIGAPTREGAE
jgi:ABC-2 type transport system ATP-binding protein